MSSADIVIRHLRNSFTVFTTHSAIRTSIAAWAEGFLRQPSLNRQSRAPAWVKHQDAIEKQDEYFIYNHDLDEYVFASGLYDKFKQFISTIQRRSHPYMIKEIPFETYEPAKVKFDNIKFDLIETADSPYVYQNDVLKFAQEDGRNNTILEIQTGKGKTAMAMKILAANGERFFFITKAGYIPQWMINLTTDKRGMGLRPKELIRCKTKSDLDSVYQMGKDGELDEGSRKCKAIVVSSHTFDNWIREYLDGTGSHDVTKFCELCKIGMVLYDESHELFRMNYWSYLLLTAPKFLDLSATLVPDREDQFMRDRYEERFPREARYDKLEYDQYIDACSVYYYMSDKKLARRINGMKMYNHTEFEKQIMSKNKYLDAYFEMIFSMMNEWYFKSYKEGQRILIFFATKQMCTDFTKYVKSRRPSFVVQRYIEGDSFKAIKEADIIISTPGKAGTAIDIPGLIMTIVTCAINKQQKNLQILGRTRKDFKWGLAPKAVFLHCRDLRKHIDYLCKRINIFKGKVKNFDILDSRFNIK